MKCCVLWISLLGGDCFLILVIFISGFSKFVEETQVIAFYPRVQN